MTRDLALFASGVVLAVACAGSTTEGSGHAPQSKDDASDGRNAGGAGAGFSTGGAGGTIGSGNDCCTGGCKGPCRPNEIRFCGNPSDTYVVTQACSSDGTAWLPTEATSGHPGMGGTVGAGGFLQGAGGIDPSCCPNGCLPACSPGNARYCGGNGTDSYQVYQYCRCDGSGWGPLEPRFNYNTGGAGCGLGGSTGGSGNRGVEAGVSDAGIPQDASVRDASADGAR